MCTVKADHAATVVVDSTLAALRSCSTHLDTVILKRLSGTALQYLLHFSSLTCRDLQATQDTMDLAPLQALPKLTQLRVCRGKFDNLEMVSHVTKLSLDHATALAAQACWSLSATQELHFAHAVHFHPEGLSAFKQLLSLHCLVSSVNATVPDRLQARFDMIPYPAAAMTALSRLTRLHLANNIGVNMDISGVYHLTGLRELHLQCVLDTSQQLTLLSNLTSICCSGHGTKASLLVFDVPWRLMPSLQRVTLCKDQFSFGNEIYDLVQMKALTHIRFFEWTPYDSDTCSRFWSLMLNAKLQRPELIVSLE